ncbi:hypothetical protein [Nocardia farcinica]|uniref:hypothetical protein n=1 Tax=Nocardia farcinica TaxID=37329 RepID=UPI00245513D8|nr:hypothetical protein [Nocardia farcinica]
MPVVDRYTGSEYGSLTVDGTGALRDLNLEAYEVSQSNEADVVAAIIAALNSPAAKPQIRRAQELTRGNSFG